jgi:sarcosine oxidase, subunit beta
MRAEVVVVGGGVIGLSVALFTAKRKDALREPVVLLERDAPGAGASGRSSALVWQQDEERSVVRMARDGLRYYSSFQRQTGRSLGFRGVGVLTLLEGAGSPERKAGEHRFQQTTGLGIQLEMLEAGELRRRFPSLIVPDDALAIWEPEGGYLDVELAFEAGCALARNAGAIVRPGADASALLVEAGQVVGVETPAGRIEARKVVVATGPWSEEFLAGVGVRMPLLTRRTREHQLATPGAPEAPLPSARTLARSLVMGPDGVEPPGGGGGHSHDLDRRFTDGLDQLPLGVAHPVLVDRALDMVVHCEPARRRTYVRRLRRAGEPMTDPDAPQPPVEPEFRAWARGVLERRLPVYQGQPDLDSRAGWTTAALDGRAIVGPVPGIEGLYVATGFGDDAFRLAPAVGEGLAQELCGQPISAYDPALFSPSRFQMP